MPKYTSNESESLGQWLYENGKVHNLQVKDAGDGYVKLTANVSNEKGNKVYNASVEYDGNSLLRRFSCTCFHSLFNRDPCEHVLAVVNAYDGQVEANKPKETSALLKSLLNTPAVTAADTADKSLLVYLTFTAPGSVLTAEFSIRKNNDRSYIIKDLISFFAAINEQRQESYGKSLTFTHSLNAFEENSRKLVSFLLSLSRTSPQSFHSRYVELNGLNLDRFYELIQPLPIYSKALNSPIELTDGNYQMKTAVQPDQDGYNLTGDVPDYSPGNDYLYIFLPKEKKVLRCPMVDQPTRSLLETLRLAEKQPLHIAPADLPAFSRKVYPVLKNNTELKAEKFDPYDYMPVPPQYSLYLDMPEKNIITGKMMAKYPSGVEFNVLETAEDKERDLENEQETVRYVQPWFTGISQEDMLFFIEDDPEKQYQLLKDGIAELNTRIAVYVSDAIRKINIKSGTKFRIGVTSKSNLLNLDIVSDELNRDQLADIFAQYEPKKRYYRLADGTVLHLEEEDDSLLDQLKDSLGVTVKNIKEGTASLPLFRSFAVKETAEKNEGTFALENSFKETVDQMENVDLNKYQDPADLQATLYDYQRDGYRWLCALKDSGFAALLADDMGLGKTLQVIAFLLNWRERGKALVVCPASLIYNWQKEIQKFAPTMHTVVLGGDAGSRLAMIKNSQDQDILISSYDALKRDIDAYADLPFSCEVIDEAQYIKNADTQASQAVKKIQSTFRIALTGTPIENRLSELWSIFDYLLPDYLYSYSDFRKKFEIPIVQDNNEEKSKRLQDLISPFVLRRIKKEVLTQLPDKIEETRLATLTGEQAELYTAHVQRIKSDVAKQDDKQFSQNKIAILAELTKLRQICCDPHLMYNNYSGPSAKTDLCMELLQQAILNNHKVLLFSQFTSMLDILQKNLDELDISYFRISGDTPKEKRAAMTAAFQKDDTSVFLISLKAGGTGLNLTAADIVIHYDPWWNTAVESQAEDRAYRIGQANKVTVYRLICEKTIEERIIELQNQKHELVDKVFSGENISSNALSKDMLTQLLD